MAGIRGPALSIEVCRQLKRQNQTKHIPVLMLTARGEESDRVWGHDSDVDFRTVDVHVGRLRKALHLEGEPDPYGKPVTRWTMTVELARSL